jgi:hypothetical protein
MAKEYWLAQMNASLKSSILNLTSYGTYAYKISSPRDSFDFFDIVVADTVDDFCLYWNIRAMHEAAHFK